MGKRRYCEMCDEWFPLRKTECPKCGMAMKADEWCLACDREFETAGGYLTDLEYHTCSSGKYARAAARPAVKEPA